MWVPHQIFSSVRLNEISSTLSAQDLLFEWAKLAFWLESVALLLFPIIVAITENNYKVWVFPLYQKYPISLLPKTLKVQLNISTRTDFTVGYIVNSFNLSSVSCPKNSILNSGRDQRNQKYIRQWIDSSAYVYLHLKGFLSHPKTHTTKSPLTRLW